MTAVVFEAASVSAIGDQLFAVARVLNGLDPRAGHASVQDGDGDPGAVEPLRAEAVRADLRARVLIGHGVMGHGVTREIGRAHV